jgi:hypothetical protein
MAGAAVATVEELLDPKMPRGTRLRAAEMVLSHLKAMESEALDVRLPGTALNCSTSVLLFSWVLLVTLVFCRTGCKTYSNDTYVMTHLSNAVGYDPWIPREIDSAAVKPKFDLDHFLAITRERF